MPNKAKVDPRIPISGSGRSEAATMTWLAHGQKWSPSGLGQVGASSGPNLSYHLGHAKK